MTKPQRLLLLLDVLRRRRRPVTAAALADEMCVSIRTIYRDVQSLVAIGVAIEGEAGIGYVMRDGFFLAPMMFNHAELEALALGARWVEQNADKSLADAAVNAIGRVAAASPPQLRDPLSSVTLFVRPNEPRREPVWLGVVRDAIRLEERLILRYSSRAGTVTDRVVWPLAIAFYDQPMLAAWCELRNDFRTFSIETIRAASSTGERMPERRERMYGRYLNSFVDSAEGAPATPVDGRKKERAPRS